MARASEVGLAVSGMIPVCSELGLLEQIGKSPRAGGGLASCLGKCLLQSLRASSPCFLLIQPVGCSAFGLQAADWDPGEGVQRGSWPCSQSLHLGRRWCWPAMAAIFQDDQMGQALCWGGESEDFLEEAAPEGQVGIN